MRFSPQTIQIYQTLGEAQCLSVREIGGRLKILPNAVYRSVRPLVRYGFIRVVPGYPVAYSVVHDPQAVDNAVARWRAELSEVLGLPAVRSAQAVVTNCDELLAMTSQEVKQAQQSVDFLVSGLEVPAETILIYKQAVDRGVRIRALVQQPGETRAEMYQNWQAIGVQVRRTTIFVPARLFVIDRQICVYTSYDPAQGGEARGQLDTSGVLGQLMDQLFVQYWQSGIRPEKPVK